VFSPSVGGKHFWWMENMWLRTPSVGAAKIYVECTWSWSWEHDKFLNKGHKVWSNSIQTQVEYVEDLSILYLALVGHYSTTKEKYSYSF
jgi:hypothetical protein